MKNNKKNILQFLVWLRNGTAFCTTWFLIIWLIYSHISNHQTISVNGLTKLLLLVFGGVFIFSILFTQLLIRRWSFTKRLTGFMATISIYECAGFYWIGIFSGAGTFLQWIAFLGIVCFLYLLCIAVYQQYSRRLGTIYTQALEKYQIQRRNADES